MPTIKEIFRHIRNSHFVESFADNEKYLLRLLYENNADVSAVHDELHQLEDVTHTHETDGSITPETKTVLGDKSITRTANGWSFDSTAAEALQDLNSIVNNRSVKVHIDSTGADDMEGFILSEVGTVEVKAATFLDIVRLLLGESYFKFDEQQQPEEPTPV